MFRHQPVLFAAVKPVVHGAIYNAVLCSLRKCDVAVFDMDPHMPPLPSNVYVLRVADHRWIPCDSGNVPQGAFICGLDKDGSSLYVGRAFHGGDLLPGKIVPSHGCAYVSRDGEEHGVKNYEVRHHAWISLHIICPL
jgi:hypothetical protein